MPVQYVVFPGLTEWSIARVSQGAVKWLSVSAVEQTQLFPLVKLRLRELGFTDQSILLALPSDWCLCANINCTGLPIRGREMALGFRFEEQLPLGIEELTISFTFASDSCLGIAVETAKMASIINSLDSLGIHVASICPTALLIAQEIAAENIDVAILFLQDRVDWVMYENSAISNWVLSGTQNDVMIAHARKLNVAGDNGLRAIAVGLPQCTVPACLSLKQHFSQNPLELAALAAAKLLTAQKTAPIELRRGKLASPRLFRQFRAPILCAFSSAIIFSVCLSIFPFYRSAQYNRLAFAANQEQIRAYQAAVPNTAVPPAIMSRLRSEDERLTASRAFSSVPDGAFVSVLPLIRDTLAALPRNIRFHLTDLRFESRQLFLDGQTLDHMAADRIAASLRERLDFVVNPPHTEQAQGEDVNFTISAVKSEEPQ